MRIQWEQKVRDYRQSGLSLLKWCQQTGVNPNTMRKWVGAFSSRHQQKESDGELKWLPVIINEDSSSVKSTPSELLIEIGKAHVVVKQGFDADLLRDIVRVLVAIC